MEDLSLEYTITNGVSQYIEEIKTDLNILQITFVDLKGKKTYMKVMGFNHLSFTLTSDGEIYELDEKVLHTMIGISFEKKHGIYKYCMQTDVHAMTFESTNFPVINKV